MRARRWLMVGLAVVALLVLMAWLQRGKASYSDPLDPANPRPVGAQAVARVLADHGVPVRVVRSQAELLRTPIDADTVVVTTGLDGLGRSTLHQLRQHAATAKAEVYVGNGLALSELFELSDPLAPTDGEVAARCDLPLVKGLTLETPMVITMAPTGCFRTGAGSLLVQPDERTWLLAAESVLGNDDITDADNAALSLRLLGQGERVVWYLPSVADTLASDGAAITKFLPPAVIPLVWLGGFVLVGFLLWRGRRFGPLVTEPIPVVVKASETTLARGRLYESTRDRAHAAEVLARATRERLKASLRMPSAHDDELIHAVGQHLGQTGADVRRLLDPPAPPDDTALAVLARDLLTLEDEVPR